MVTNDCLTGSSVQGAAGTGCKGAVMRQETTVLHEDLILKVCWLGKFKQQSLTLSFSESVARECTLVGLGVHFCCVNPFG